MAYEAKVIADSISAGQRLTTMQVTHPRIVHAEFMTHCAFARNASSSRAIPFSKMVEAVAKDPFIPVWWGKNQSGMQAKEELDSDKRPLAKMFWYGGLGQAIKAAKALNDLGLHKQICNRLLEPWGWITVCVTGDKAAWSNYFALRCHPDAQPEIQKQAYLAREAYLANKPRELLFGEWHLPYVSPEEAVELDKGGFGITITTSTDNYIVRRSIAVSVGRCARVSYLTQEGKRDPEKDVELHNRLFDAKPMHASPFEHVAQAESAWRYGKYTGWRSYRHMIPGEMTTDYFERMKNEATGE